MTVKPPAPKTRRRIPRAEREEAMLDAAGASFAEHGFHGASMDAIAADAGISKPMLYNYFGSKEGLYTAYIERSGRELLSAMRRAAPADAPADEQLAAGVSAFLTYVDEHRAGWAVLYHEAATRGGPVAVEVAALRARIATLVARSFALRATDEAPPGSHDAFAHAFVGAGESLANWWLEHPTEPKAEIARLLLRFT